MTPHPPAPDSAEIVTAANRVRDCLLAAFPKEPRVPIPSDTLGAIAAIDTYNEVTGQPRSDVTTRHLAAAMFSGNEEMLP
jgi:hypothetical protein